MDQEILRVFFSDVRCAVVMHFSAWSAVYEDGGEWQREGVLCGTNSIIVLMFVESQRVHV
jgi:UDP-glucose 4-epimerase